MKTLGIMVQLHPDFHFERNGIIARLVCEEDAPFILKLRTNPERNKYLNYTPNELCYQLEWIKEYKKREKAGKEYYLIFSQNNQKYGVQRIYNIDWEHLSFTIGSWVCTKESSMEGIEASILYTFEIAFNILGLLLFTIDVMKDNIPLLRCYRKLPYLIEYGDNGVSILFYSTKETILRHVRLL